MSLLSSSLFLQELCRTLLWSSLSVVQCSCTRRIYSSSSLRCMGCVILAEHDPDVNWHDLENVENVENVENEENTENAVMEYYELMTDDDKTIPRSSSLIHEINMLRCDAREGGLRGHAQPSEVMLGNAEQLSKTNLMTYREQRESLQELEAYEMTRFKN